MVEASKTGHSQESPDSSDGRSGVSGQKFKPETKEWTVMVYFASDNPLAPEVIIQLKAIKEAGFHPQVNVITQFDPETPSTPTQVFDVNLINKLKSPGRPNIGFHGNDPYVRNLIADKLWGNTPRDRNIRDTIARQLMTIKNADGEPIRYNAPTLPPEMDNKQDPTDSLEQFLTFCRENYPARRYALIILGHGVVVGNDVFLYAENVEDDTSRRLANAKKRNNGNGNGSGTAPAIHGTNGKASADEKNVPRHYMRLTDLGAMLEDFTNNITNNGGEFEFIGFQSCSMSGFEVAYELRNTAKYLLASQGPAYVGTWPYRQILIRIFNDLEAVMFCDGDLKDPAGLIGKLQGGQSPITYSGLSAKQKALFTPYTSTPPMPTTVAATTVALPVSANVRLALIDALNDFVNGANHATPNGTQPYAGSAPVPQGQLSANGNGRTNGNGKPHGKPSKWSNRAQLMKSFRQELQPKPTILGTIESIFDYCIYNSYDFQLAGYSYDMSLCDLTVLKDSPTGGGSEGTLPAAKADCVTVAIRNLSAVLCAAVDDSRGCELILLAHWDAQSYWSEQYTDLYDFCFCLDKRCEDAASTDTGTVLSELRKACQVVMNVLKPVGPAPNTGNGAGLQSTAQGQNPQSGLIIRSEFVGPSCQYSHGLSVFFPWSTPDEGFFPAKYEDYFFGKPLGSTNSKPAESAAQTQACGSASNDNVQGDLGWTEFLIKYLKATKRHARVDNTPGLDPELIALLQHISARVYNSDGQLTNMGSLGGQVGSQDPTGDDCDCPSIKNYPTFTRYYNENEEKGKTDEQGNEEKFPFSQTLADHVRKDMFG